MKKARYVEVPVVQRRAVWQCEHCDYESTETYAISRHEIDCHTYIAQSGDFYYFNDEMKASLFADSDTDCPASVDWEGPGWYRLSVEVDHYPVYRHLKAIEACAKDLLDQCNAALKETPDGV